MRDLKSIEREEIVENEEYVVVIKEWEDYGVMGWIDVVVGVGDEILERIKEYDENDVEVYKM